MVMCIPLSALGLSASGEAEGGLLSGNINSTSFTRISPVNFFWLQVCCKQRVRKPLYQCYKYSAKDQSSSCKKLLS